MTEPGALLIVGFLLLALATVKPLGLYMTNVFEARPIWPLRLGAPLERWIYRLCGVEPAREMGWKEYAAGLLIFNTLGALTVYLLQRLQLWQACGAATGDRRPAAASAARQVRETTSLAE